MRTLAIIITENFDSSRVRFKGEPIARVRESRETLRQNLLVKRPPSVCCLRTCKCLLSGSPPSGVSSNGTRRRNSSQGRSTSCHMWSLEISSQSLDTSAVAVLSMRDKWLNTASSNSGIDVTTSIERALYAREVSNTGPEWRRMRHEEPLRAGWASMVVVQCKKRVSLINADPC